MMSKPKKFLFHTKILFFSLHSTNQLRWLHNYVTFCSDHNYKQAGDALQVDLLNNPDLVVKNAVISFKTAIWFWMTPQYNKPSSHDVITNKWTPSDADRSAGRVPGYGVITNIINGGFECNRGQNSNVEDRIGFYKRYCDMMQIAYGDNLDCNSQAPFG